MEKEIKNDNIIDTCDKFSVFEKLEYDFLYYLWCGYNLSEIAGLLGFSCTSESYNRKTPGR